ncbi:MAG TPA: hypothetical protein PKL83_06690 [bacterium]|nr:hypothetical protein [bacterium]
MSLTAHASVDSKTLFIEILRTADFPADQHEELVKKFENAVYVQTLKTLLNLLPAEQRKKLESTMHFKPDFFLERAIAILQAFATPDQILKIFDKTSEETFLEFFDTFLASCDEQQKKRIDDYLNHLE